MFVGTIITQKNKQVDLTCLSDSVILVMSVTNHYY